MSKHKEELLNEKIKALEERNKSTTDLNQSLMKKLEEYNKHFKKNDNSS